VNCNMARSPWGTGFLLRRTELQAIWMHQVGY
jgi:hypothetical protein